jgi:hypothetical protein
MVRKTCWTSASRTCAIATCVLAVAGCATVYGTAPTEQLAVANAAISDATGAGASQYAATDYRNAQRKLDRAQGALRASDYDAARNLAEEAAADAKLAAARARTAKAERAAAEVQEGIRALRDEIARTSQ